MSFKVFVIIVFFYSLLASIPVVYDFYKGRNWKTTSLIMLLGWAYFVCQLSESIK